MNRNRILLGAAVAALLAAAAWTQIRYFRWFEPMRTEGTREQVLTQIPEASKRWEGRFAREAVRTYAALYPEDPLWIAKEAEILGRKDIDGQIRAAARNALVKAEAALNAAASDEKRWYALGDAAFHAFYAGQSEKARAYADELLASAEKYKGNWNYGNAIHHGNAMLGRLALSEGKLDEARLRLLDSGRTPGSPQLGSFGPNMALAAELLDRGDKETVLAYLELCARFWDMDEGRLKAWADSIRRGERDVFLSNLDYH